MAFRVSIAGASGYAGGELIRLVLGHAELRLAALAAGAKAGQSVAATHPGLAGVVTGTFAPTDPDVLADADLVLLALPHGESAAVVAELPEDLPVVDLGADFRLRDQDKWRHYYGGTPHAGTWPYGLPELPDQRPLLRGATRIANPGCYATAVALALAPLLAAELVESNDIVVVAASGTSGAGRKATEALSATQVMGSISAYKAGGAHQHIPEMEQSLTAASGRQVELGFTPLLAPMPRGILATCTARAVPRISEELARDAMHGAYDREQFVHVLPAGQLPTTASTVGGNSAHIQVLLDSHTQRVVVLCALDNLVKGAAGQALQNANILLGMPEGLGLPVAGIAP